MLRNLLEPKTLIIEGVDGMGKSTLGEALSNYFLELPLIICGPAPKTLDDIEYWIHRHERSVILGGFILDRVTVFSHYVYKTVLSSTPYEELLLTSAKRLAKYNPIVIYCKTDSPKHEIKDYDDPKVIELIMQNVDKLDAGYKNLFATIGIEPIVYDFKEPNAFAKLTKKIEDLHNER